MFKKTTITSLYKHTEGILTTITELHKECNLFFHEADGKTLKVTASRGRRQRVKNVFAATASC